MTSMILACVSKLSIPLAYFNKLSNVGSSLSAFPLNAYHLQLNTIRFKSRNSHRNPASFKRDKGMLNVMDWKTEYVEK